VWSFATAVELQFDLKGGARAWLRIGLSSGRNLKWEEERMLACWEVSCSLVPL